MSSSLRHLSRFLTTVLIVVLAIALVLIAREGISASILVWLVPFAVGLAVLVIWHARGTRYTCPECAETFAISAWRDFLSAHSPGKKLLRCPRCGATGWCAEVDTVPFHDV